MLGLSASHVVMDAESLIEVNPAYSYQHSLAIHMMRRLDPTNINIKINQPWLPSPMTPAS